MGFDRDLGRRAGAGPQGESHARSPGKHTLTEDIHDAAAHGTSGPAGALPHRDQIQRSFGRHDIGHVKAHVGGAAEEGAEAMGADAFAMGDRVAFGSAPDLHTAAHEAAHVVQQRGGIQLKGGVGEEGDPHERHADAVADLVVQGKSSEALLDQHAGGGSGTVGVQRHAFVAGKQIKKKDKIATGPVAAFVTDDVVRSYKTEGELQQHAAGSTDYLGNLADGTWLRFSPTGLNILGENHTLVKLSDVMQAVGSKSFISERFATDDLTPGSKLETEYMAEAKDRFKEMGIENEPDKKQFGAESLFPKMGYAMAAALAYFNGEKKLEDLKDYAGKPLQRYLKLSWAHGKDLRVVIAQKRKAKEAIPPKLEEMCKAVSTLEPKLDKFITSLPAEGNLGEALEAAKDPDLVPLLAQFATTVVDAMVEKALDDPTARLSKKQKENLADPKATTKDKLGALSDWRNDNFEDSVKAAAARGVRYAGMGAGHLYHLQGVGLPKGTHDYDMSGDALEKFENETKKLAKIAKKQ